MKLDENIVKKRANHLKYTLMINKLNQNALEFYPNGISSSSVSKIINCKGEYLTEYQVDKVIRILEKYKEDFPNRQFLIPRKEYLLGIDDYMTERDYTFLSRKDRIRDIEDKIEAFTFLFENSLSKYGGMIEAAHLPSYEESQEVYDYDDETLIKLYEESLNKSDNPNDDFVFEYIKSSKDDKPIPISYNDWLDYMDEIEKYSDYLLWRIINKNN